MADRKIHFIGQDQYRWVYCGRSLVSPFIQFTEHPDDVTCKRCIKRIDTFGTGPVPFIEKRLEEYPIGAKVYK